MAVSTTHSTVPALVTSFVAAPSDEVDSAFHRLVDGVWHDGGPTGAALSAVPVLLAGLDRLPPSRQARLLVLLGLLAESEYPTAGTLTAAVAKGLERYLDLLRATDHEPLRLALLYLLSHLSADRGRILATVGDLAVDLGDRTRLERALADLDPARPDLGRVWPSPSIWALDDTERDFDQGWIAALTPDQVRTNWHNDTRTVFGTSGAKAYHAAVHGQVAAVDAVVPTDRIPQPGADSRVDLFARHADALRCPNCAAGLDFSTGRVVCTGCGTAFPVANGILDLSPGERGDGDEATADLLAKLAEMPSMGLFYESVLRPNYLNIAGSNWSGTVTLPDEFAYLETHIRPVDGPVLDLAAGAGRWTAVIERTVGADRLIALDMALPMLNVLRGRVPDVPAVQGSALRLPFGDATLGGIVCWNALQAFPDDAAAAIAEMGRCLRPGGSLTMMTFRWSDDPVARYFQASQYFPSRPQGHLLFGLDELRRWLADAGLTVREITTPATFVFLTAERTGAPA